MTPEKMAQALLKAHGKADAKRVAETTLKASETDVFWKQVVNILKK